MKVAVIGATGSVGPHIVGELLDRGHDVTAVSRHPEKLGARPKLTGVAGDVSKPAELAQILIGHDAIISSVRFADFEPEDMLEAIRGSGVPRYLVVGGAGSLRDTNGRPVYERPAMPEPARHNSMRGSAWLETLKSSDLNWTMLCPGNRFHDGARTGTFRLGQDDLIIAPDGSSSISYQDFAVALIDELQKPANPRKRFAVGY